MSQLSGAFTIEIPTDRIAASGEQLAELDQRLVALQQQIAELATHLTQLNAHMANRLQGGQEIYDRGPESGPEGTGRPWAGARFDAGGPWA